MLIDTHCHLNMVVKKNFDVELSKQEIYDAKIYIDEAKKKDVTTIINVGTSLIESKNCIALAQHYNNVFATIGIHPNDLTIDWQQDLSVLKKLLLNKEEHKIVGIGECGMDKHYPDYNLQRQVDGFKAQIELSLEYNIALVVHTRDAVDETLRVLEEYKKDIKRGIIHCFSENQSFADTVIGWGYCIGLGGTITYPKNNELRQIAINTPLEHIVLETDAPFLPPQKIRGQVNTPQQIYSIAEYLAELRNVNINTIAQTTTANAQRIFNLP